MKTRPGHSGSGSALRRPVTVLVLLACAATPAVLAADSEKGATVGLDLGDQSVGLWDVFQYDHPGGVAGLGLSWAPSLFPGADYDLHLYPSSALDDRVLLSEETIAASAQRTFEPHAEGLSLTLPAGRYYVAVMPWQTQGEIYTLTAATGVLEFATTAPGVSEQGERRG